MTKMRDIPMLHVFMTDFGEVRLTDAFVSEASARWPGNVQVARSNLSDGGPDYYDTKEPKWVGEVLGALTALTEAAESARVRPVALKSLAALAPYGIEA